jgi:hypothetical protein
MTDEPKISFTAGKSIRYKSEFDTVNCEKVYLSDIDGDGHPEIIIPRSSSSNDKAVGEIVVYDLDLNLKASDGWDGTAMDVVAADVDDDGTVEIIAVGGIKNSAPIVRVYRYNENYKGNLELSQQVSWRSPAETFSTAKAVHAADINNDGKMEVAVLSVVEGSRENKGYAQLRLYDAGMQLRRIARWTPMSGSIVKWGHCLTAADIDGDGHDELVVLTNFRHERKQRSDLRIFDRHLLLKGVCQKLADESLFATCISAGDIDQDGNTEIVVGSGVFSKVWQGATNQLMVFDGNLDLKGKATWKTFRHSWVWDLQIADVDDDGDQEIITYGGTSMTGRNQEEANIMGEIRAWAGAGLTAKDMFIWQSKPGEDTRPSRAFALKDEHTRFVIATSRWSRRRRGQELELRMLNYKPAAGAIERYSEFIKAYDERSVEVLKAFTVPEDIAFTPIALEALAVIGGTEATGAVSELLGTQDQLLFLRAVGVLRHMGDEAIDELHRIGFTIPDDWIIVSPFDNTGNCGFHKQYSPEVDVNLDAFYAGKDKIVRWGKMDYYRRDAYINLAYTHFESFERTGIEFVWNVLRTESAAYALTYIHSPASREAQFRIGSADGMKVWVDDELKYSADVVRDAAPDQDTISISLMEGRNRILLKVANHKTDGWGFYFRVTDVEGKPIPNLRYERPEVSHVHNQMLTCEQLVSLLETPNENLRCLAASQLALSADKRGNEALFHLLQSKDASVGAKAALALTLAGDSRGTDPLVKYAPGQDHLFQIAAGYALKRAENTRAEQFSIDNLKDEDGKKLMELRVTDRENGFSVSPVFTGDDTAFVEVVTDRRFHLGESISARCAIISGYGIREPKYRGMGLGGIAIKKACDFMTEKGVSCSTVSTGARLVAHRLYCRNGYVDRRFPWQYTKKLERGDDRENGGKIRVREYIDADRADVSELREQYIRNTVGPADWSPRSNYGQWIRVVEDGGKMIGYADVYLDPFEPAANVNLLHIDMNFPDEQKAARMLLSGIHKYALDEGRETITFRDPPVRYRDILLQVGYCIEPHCIRYGWVNMFRVVDLAGFLREISNLLSLRLQRSPNAGWCGSLGLKGERLKAAIGINSDGSANVEDNGAENADICIVANDRTITSLVSGDADIWELYRQHALNVSPILNERIRGLIESLFPVMPHKQDGWW